MKIPDTVFNTLNRLEIAGFSAYLVGGCMRDFIMHKRPLDYDIATSATPEQVKQVFSSERLVLLGEKYGTIVVIFSDYQLEITTFRSDGEYFDGRHPHSVSFTVSIEEDLSRRDFTMNAIAFSPTYGMVDPFDGIADINNGIIRTVGEPTTRFMEDRLRIFRAIRFASVLGFSLDDELVLAMNKLSDGLLEVSKERITVELLKLLMGGSAGRVIYENMAVLGVVFPINAVDEKILVLSEIPRCELVRIAYFFVMCGATSTNLADYLKKICLTRSFKKNLQSVFEVLEDNCPNFDKIYIRSILSRYGYDVSLAVFVVKSVLYGVDIGQVISCLDELENNKDYTTLDTLAVNGDDIKSFGIAGKEIGDTLYRLVQLVNEDSLPNNRVNLMNFLKRGNN